MNAPILFIGLWPESRQEIPPHIEDHSPSVPLKLEFKEAHAG